MDYAPDRAQVYQTVMKAKDAGLVRLSAGNFSRRTTDGEVAITPTSIPYDQLSSEDISIIDLNGSPIEGAYRCSSEAPMHLAIYRKLPAVRAIVHTHSLYALTFAALGKEVPVVSLELLVCGGPIPVAPWQRPGTSAVGEGVVSILTQRPELKVVLLQNHGLVAVGQTLDEAFSFAYDAEVGMQVYYQALQLGSPHILTSDQVDGLLNV